MKDKITLFLKGIVMGIANIIPGISGGTLALTLGIYEKLIDIISHFTKNIKENIKFIILLGSGIVLSILLFSNIISYCLENYRFPTILFFIGIIIGGLPLLLKKVKGTSNISNYIIFSITFMIIMIMTFASVKDNNISLSVINIGTIIGLFISGVIAATTMILPGISGSFMLMLFGYYTPIVNAISDLSKLNNVLHNLIILGFLGMGILLGIFASAKAIEALLKKYEIKTYYGILGFVVASIISIFITSISNTINAIQIIVGIIFMILGIILGKVMAK